MQAEVKDFNPPYMVRFLAVSRTSFCADLANLVKERKHRMGVSSPALTPTPTSTLWQPALRPQCAPPSA